MTELTETEIEAIANYQYQLIDELSASLKTYLDDKQVAEVVRAYHYGAEAHLGQFRKTGHAYICHPLAVALILAEMRMDAKGIMAAILHDVVEDTPISKEQIEKVFCLEVAELVDGVTKLTQIDNKNRDETHAESVRKMFLAMAKDLRVIMVKLADRLHNMQTIDAMKPHKKRRIAKETLEIYVPIANRLGMNKIRHQLELLSFKAMYPLRHQVLQYAVKKARGHRREYIDRIENSIKQRLKQEGIEADVVGREKHLYSIYQKMRRKKITFSDVFDVYAFRVYCDNVDSCYRILGVTHNLYQPKPGKFKDYIALPKDNGYQSLHTILVGSEGTPVEIQIRTRQMHRLSESGIAAHWLYKADGDADKLNNFKVRANEWIRDLLELQKTSGNSLEFIENLKVDLYPQEIFVFTPQGKIVKLPRGATIIDFAYAIHTDVGNSCISGRIDKQLVPLQSTLENGQTIDIITKDWAKPNPQWLNYVITTKARSGIRHYLKHFKQQEAINLGARLLDKELHNLNIRLDEISDTHIQHCLETFGVHSMMDLLEEIGLGNKMPLLVAKRLYQQDINMAVKLDDTPSSQQNPLIIKGTEGMVVIFAKCCHPLPGDPIIASFNPGRGIMVHHNECRNSADLKKHPLNLLDIEWCNDISGDFSAEIRIELKNERGTLATIAAAISKMDSNIENVQVIDQDEKVSTDLIILSVRDRTHLAAIFKNLKKLPIVLKITRMTA